MSRFIEDAIGRAGLGWLLTARRAGDVEAIRAGAKDWSTADLLVLGAVADVIRAEEIGDVVRIHETHRSEDVTWVAHASSDLEVLRAVAVARITAPKGGRVGLDYRSFGLELAQVALGFGASDLAGAITKKSGLPILDDETKKVKGQGLVELRAVKRRELATLVSHAGRRAVFADDLAAPSQPELTQNA